MDSELQNNSLQLKTTESYNVDSKISRFISIDDRNTLKELRSSSIAETDTNLHRIEEKENEWNRL